MVSAAEQLAANLNFSALAKAEELKRRIWFTLGALLVYRLGTYIPLPGIDPTAWEQIFRTNSGGILGMFNMFAGGGIHRMAIFALKLNVVNLDRVQAAIERGALDGKDTVDAEALVRAGVLRRAKDGVRLLGKGEIKAAVQFAVYGASKSAVAAVEKAGGSVKILAPQKPEAAGEAAE